MKKKIIISGGGTLGHILPIIPVVLDIYNDFDLYYIGTQKGMEKDYFNKNNLNQYFKQTYFLDMVGVNRNNIFKNFNTLLKYISVNKEIKNIYKDIKPDLVIGMGGYISGVCINIAINKKIKTIIHEQNAVLGLANKLVYKKVNRLLLSYDIDNLNTDNKKLIGNPRYSFIKENYYPRNDNYILIVGGSLGSKYINDLIIDNIEYFKFNNYYIKIVVGQRYYKNNTSKINKVLKENNNIEIYPFLNNLIDIMCNATIVVSRSGATTVSEIIALTKPSILIPSPNVTADHQTLNANYLLNNNCCLLINESLLTKKSLYENISLLLNDLRLREEIINNLKTLITNNPKDDFIKIIKEETCYN